MDTKPITKSNDVLSQWGWALSLSLVGFMSTTCITYPPQTALKTLMSMEMDTPMLMPALETVGSKVSVKADRKKNNRILNLRTYLIMKRVLDIVLSGAMLVFFAPLMLALAIIIKLDSDGPVIFSQERVGSRVRGKGGNRSWEARGFTVFKFRTMYHNADSERHKAFVQALIRKDDQTLSAMQGGKETGAAKYKMVNDPRITKVGAFLRKTSLDELPQLWNVFKGDMSLVGPRPAIAYEVEMYSDRHLERLGAIPGLTGLWQVTSRSTVDFDGMVDLDNQYISAQSIWLDLKIILQTPLAVISKKGAV